MKIWRPKLSQNLKVKEKKNVPISLFSIRGLFQKLFYLDIVMTIRTVMELTGQNYSKQTEYCHPTTTAINAIIRNSHKWNKIKELLS